MQSNQQKFKIERVGEAPNGAIRLFINDGSEMVVGVKSWNRLELSLEKELEEHILFSHHHYSYVNMSVQICQQKNEQKYKKYSKKNGEHQAT